MRRVNPAFIPRNHRVEAALNAASERGDFKPFRRLLEILQRPYDDQPEAAEYGRPPSAIGTRAADLLRNLRTHKTGSATLGALPALDYWRGGTMLSIDPAETASREPSMADLAPMHTDRTIVGIENDTKGVSVLWDDGGRSRFHARWLRDNCACPECRHPQALERTYMFVDHAAPSVDSAALGANEVLEVRFQTGDGSHVSRFTKGWLRTHDSSERASSARRTAPQLWDAGITHRLPSFDYLDYMQTNTGLRAWLEALRDHGIVLLRGVPQQPGKLLDVAHRIGPVRGSNFGEYYDVVSMRNPNASAYTPMGLELHTDLANWASPPDVQLLCCLKNSATGGESVFADGFNVAESLRATDPEAFNLLSTRPSITAFTTRAATFARAHPRSKWIAKDG